MAKANEVATQNANAVAVPDFLKGMMNDNRGSGRMLAQMILLYPALSWCNRCQNAAKRTTLPISRVQKRACYITLLLVKLYGESVNVVPVTFKKEFLLWRDQDLGGGFGGVSYRTRRHTKPKKHRISLRNGKFWTRRSTSACWSKKAKTLKIVISMAKSKGKCSRKWNSMVRLNGGPRFSRVYSVHGVGDQNAAGQDYHTLDVKNVGFVIKSSSTMPRRYMN